MAIHHEINGSQLVENHGDYLLSFAMTKLNDIDLAKDLVQDTLVSALTKLDTFEHRSKLRTWLTSILNRKIIDHWRRAETRYTDPASSFFSQEGKKKGHWLENVGGEAPLESILEQIVKAETIEELHSCLDKLPEKWKGVISAKYLEELESDEICKNYQITPSNLWVIIHRAKLVLRDCLKGK